MRTKISDGPDARAATIFVPPDSNAAINRPPISFVKILNRTIFANIKWHLSTTPIPVSPPGVADFRFENLEVWKMATEIGHRIADLADAVEALGKTTFANRLREGSYSISGILAEGSNCPTKIEFSEFVGRARGAALELANLVIFFGERDLVTEVEEATLVNMLKRESKMLDNFRQSLERAGQPDAVVA